MISALHPQMIEGTENTRVLALVAGLHGDELSGIELLQNYEAWSFACRDTILLMPVLNPQGYVAKSRFYDEVDLNHIMPGDANGPTEAARHAAHICKTLAQADAIVDFHSARVGQVNYPHVRANLDEPATRELALTQPFPVVHWPATPTTLRGHFSSLSKPVVTIEAGEGLVAGYQEELKTMAQAFLRGETLQPQVYMAHEWVMAEVDGDESVVAPGEVVVSGQKLSQKGIVSPHSGIIIGVFESPTLGSRLVHIAYEAQS